MSTNITNLGLATRSSSPTRTANPVNFPRFSNDLQPIIDRFNENLRDIKARFRIADELINLKDTDGAQDIWRSQIVFLDSAIDFYLHEIIKYGFIKMFFGDWSESDEYKRMKVSLQFAIDLANNPGSISKLSDEIDEMNRFTCFMSIKQISWLFKSIDVNVNFTQNEKDLIKELFERRNQIAHQSDRLHNNPIKQTISKQYVETKINNIENLVINKIHAAIVDKG